MSRGSFFSGALNKLPSPLRSTFRGKKTKKSPSKGSTATFDFAASGTTDMGKSNKFDYTNRPNSGAKLGQIIGSALQKEVEKAKKDADKQAQKARKQSGDSDGLTSDNCSIRHILDLKAPNKDLGDAGVIALADGLDIALKSGDSTACLALEDLNLSGNGITTISLARLAPIIECSRYDLKTINLSGNKICVETDLQARQWEAFLRSFRGCFKLRRLDLSGNQQLGARALEIFARVHDAEPPVHPNSAGGEASVLSLVEEGDEDAVQYVGSTNGFVEDRMNSSNKMTAGQIMKSRRGLRSAPYITFNDIGMDDAGALWLSYVLKEHYYPNQLIDDVNATHADSVIKTYQQETSSQGIDWTDNTALGKEGKLVLEKAEALRRQNMLEDTSTVASQAPSDDESIRHSLDKKHSRAAAGERRVSIQSIRTEHGGESEGVELGSLQRKIQRNMIEHDGPHSVELWAAALEAFWASRMILYITSPKRAYYTGPPTFKILKLEVPDAVTVQPPSPVDSPTRREPVQIPFDSLKQRKEGTCTQPLDRNGPTGSHAPSSSNVPESPLTDVTNTPITPMLMQVHTQRHGAFSEGTDLHSVTDKLNVLLVDDDDPERYLQYQKRRISQADHSFRDTAMPCHLPLHLMRRIMSYMMDKWQLDVLSLRQLQTVVERGQNKDTLLSEREWLKRDGSAQLWMLLDSMKCLAYAVE